MAKRKPNQPFASIMLTNGHQSAQNSSTERGFAQSEGSEPRAANSMPDPGGDPSEREWESEGETNAAYSALDNKLRDFIYAISRGASVRHACRIAGEDYERMLDKLNSKSAYFRPELLKLVEKARAVNYLRHLEHINKATDWHAHAFWLERRERREYGPPRVGALGLEEEERPERRALIRMSPETIEALSAAYDAEHGTPEEERDGQ